MFFYGIHEIKKRVIEFLQDTLGNRPLFSRVTILNKYPSLVERDKINIIVTGSSSDQMQLSPDNFLQTDVGFSAKAKVDEHPGHFVAWVRDDLSTGDAITNRVSPGVYFFTLQNVKDSEATLLVDVLKVVKNEVVLFNYTGETQVQLDHFPVVEGSFQLFVDKALYPDDPPADFYDIDLSTGIITFKRKPAIGSKVTACYNWADASLDPIQIRKGDGRTDILKGVLLGFSEEFVEGDRAAVVVCDEREPNAVTFGGRMNINLNLDTRSQDTITSEKVVDTLTDTLWGIAKPALKDEGLDITNVTVGGESVDAEDEVGQEWAFQFSVTVGIEAEWQRRIPLLRRYSHGVINLPLDVDLLTATDEELVEASLRFLEEPIGPQETL